MEKKKILVVDDDSRNIFALSAVLKSRNFECISSSTAKEAIDLLRSDMPLNYVLLDMMMPEMDGYEAISIIKALPNRQKLPVIAVTAQAMVGDREKCLLAGADEYISKPVDIDKLVQLLSKFK
ncbi:response regulator [Flavobacterium sp. MAH-1]|uniref:Response regulator n=1 Tax=Flavobacterium agri TaxID=2743471 RepID=A0A7Y9C469_9FLAO|nr:response regulator [Flavobacterium agri]NUY79846.1 response regulator [Flavobacterium agri]NYA69871.1 response regulator [Flavobacterium agri]